MQAIVDALPALPCLRDLPEARLRSFAADWMWARLAEGEPLWSERQTADECGFLWSGRLSVGAGGVELGRARPMDLVGEEALLGGRARCLSLRAVEDAVLLLAPVESLRRLRSRQPEVWGALVDLAGAQLGTHLGRLPAGAPTVAEGPDRRPGPCPPAESLLLALPAFRGAGPALLQAVAAEMRPAPVRPGDRVSAADSLVLVAAGRFDAGGAGTVLLAGASARCVESGWVYCLRPARLDPQARLRVAEAQATAIVAELGRRLAATPDRRLSRAA